MLKRERQAYILRKVNLHNKVLSSALCTEINVSEDTIRRDLQELAEEGKHFPIHLMKSTTVQMAFTPSRRKRKLLLKQSPCWKKACLF